MASEFFKRRRQRKPRQDWNPHWIIKLLYTVFSLAVSLLKIAVGAAVTVLLIVVICGIVFVGTLGDYLQDEILTEAENWSIDDYDVEETSLFTMWTATARFSSCSRSSPPRTASGWNWRIFLRT